MFNRQTIVSKLGIKTVISIPRHIVKGKLGLLACAKGKVLVIFSPRVCYQVFQTVRNIGDHFKNKTRN